MRQRLAWATLALAIGLAGGVGGGYLFWGQKAVALSERLAGLESAAVQVQGERERLRHELGDIVRERREMAATAEHLRAQVEQQLHRLEALAAELTPPPASDEPPDAEP